MAGEITNDVLAQRLTDMRTDLHDDLKEIKERLNQLVPREVYDAQRGELGRQIANLEQAVAQQAEQRRQYNRFLVGVVAIPILSIVVQFLLAIKGVKP